jgi:glycosyltransferase involved in cell wall biosynthesis
VAVSSPPGTALLVVHALPPAEASGTPLAAAGYARELAARGWLVVVATADPAAPPWSALRVTRRAGEDFFRLPLRPVSYRGLPWPLDAPLQPAAAVPPPLGADGADLAACLWAVFGRLRPDVVHIVNPVLMGSLALQYASKRYPTVVSYHTDVSVYASMYHLGWARPALHEMMRRVYRRADVRLATSEVGAAQLAELRIGDVELWGRGVDLELFRPDRDGSAMRRRLCPDPDRKLVVYVGRIAKEKGCERLLPLARDPGPYHVALVGDGPDRARLEELFAGTRVTFAGVLRGDDLADAKLLGPATDRHHQPSERVAEGRIRVEAAHGLAVSGKRTLLLGGLQYLLELVRAGTCFGQERHLRLAHLHKLGPRRDQRVQGLNQHPPGVACRCWHVEHCELSSFVILRYLLHCPFLKLRCYQRRPLSNCSAGHDRQSGSAKAKRFAGCVHR